MSSPDRVLIVDSSDEDVALIVRELGRAGLDVVAERVDTADSLTRAMRGERWDVVLSDNEMPSFDAIHALEIVRAHDVEVSVVIVSGTIGEELAVEMMRAGAQDYVMKDRLARLGPVVRREARETELRRERKRAVEELRRAEARGVAILEASLDAVISMDHEGRIVDYNRAAEEVLGWTREEAVGLELASLIIPEDQRARHRAGLRRFLESGEGPFVGRRVETKGFRKDGAEIPVELSVVRLPGTDPPMFTGFLRDITARKQAEAALRDALRARDEFLQIASHELKTPLTPLRLQLETLARELERGGLKNDRIAAKLDVATRQTARLGRLVETLLDVSRITSGRLALEIEPFDLAELVRDVCDRSRADARKAGSDLSVRAGVPIQGRWDRSRVEQILSNMLDNAIKYGEGKPIEVEARIADGAAVVSVEDHGIGIEEEALARIFDRFERAVSPRHFGGLGLGLFIARQLAQAHGGRIDAASKPGAGSTFTLTLPAGGGP